MAMIATVWAVMIPTTHLMVSALWHLYLKNNTVLSFNRRSSVSRKSPLVAFALRWLSSKTLQNFHDSAGRFTACSFCRISFRHQTATWGIPSVGCRIQDHVSNANANQRALMARAYSSRSIAGFFSSGSLSSRERRASVMRSVKYRSHCAPMRVPEKGRSGASL